MSSLWPELERVLGEVQKPARYIGCEDGMTVPDHHPDAVAWLLLYPDTYEVGLPNQGLQILYEILNERSDAVAERSYAPLTDLAGVLRREGLPLFSVDTHRAARDFDILAFNLSAELVFTNVLECVDLAGIPVRTADRTDDDPLVLVGGHCAYNPEPLADYVDAAVLGDGEEVVGEITEVVAAWKAAGGGPRADLHRRLATVAGAYVPSLYEATFADGRLQSVRPRPEATEAIEVVEKRTVADLADWPYPKNQLVPVTEVVHDRLNVEVFRGCTRGCRFCQAGMITRPVRERPADQVRTMVSEGLKRTGYDEVALTSLSTADFSGIEQVVAETVADDACGQVSVSLPSLRVDAFTVGIAAEIQKARRTGLTFAPEAGSWRMRQVINKLIREEDLYAAVEAAYSQGWRRMKLYFLTGLPTETDEDTLGILHMARRCVEVGRQHIRNPSVTVSVGGFVPKPFTPFQWFGQNTETELRRKVGVLRDELKRDTKGYRGVQKKGEDKREKEIEGMRRSGERSLGPVVEDVWRSGGVFQEWSEHFNLELWTDALERQGLTLEEMVYRHRTEDEAFAWDHLSAGLHRDFLWQDWRDALEAVGLEDCRWTPCYDCGACTGYGIEHVVASAVPPAGGSQGTGQDLAGGGEVPVLLTTRPDTSRTDRGAPAPVGSA